MGKTVFASVSRIIKYETSGVDPVVNGLIDIRIRLPVSSCSLPECIEINLIYIKGRSTVLNDPGQSFGV